MHRYSVMALVKCKGRGSSPSCVCVLGGGGGEEGEEEEGRRGREGKEGEKKGEGEKGRRERGEGGGGRRARRGETGEGAKWTLGKKMNNWHAYLHFPVSGYNFHRVQRQLRENGLSCFKLSASCEETDGATETILQQTPN